MAQQMNTLSNCWRSTWRR